MGKLYVPKRSDCISKSKIIARAVFGSLSLQVRNFSSGVSSDVKRVFPLYLAQISPCYAVLDPLRSLI